MPLFDSIILVLPVCFFDKNRSGKSGRGILDEWESYIKDIQIPSVWFVVKIFIEGQVF